MPLGICQPLSSSGRLCGGLAMPLGNYVSPVVTIWPLMRWASGPVRLAGVVGAVGALFRLSPLMRWPTVTSCETASHGMSAGAVGP